MSPLTVDQFADFFAALHGRAPYAWQRELAVRAADGEWPTAIDLPTGAGKTACIDVAIFAMACQATRIPRDRTAPRRVFFCVNRRLIVDEAHRRTKSIRDALVAAERAAGDTVLHAVASALRAVAGTAPGDGSPPLDVLELRGGIHRENRWARSATQPTVVCTTIDQLGSRLLFRGYGVSASASPIQAALIAYDSVVLLDEAHISAPFGETLAGVRRAVDPTEWGADAIGVRPMIVVPMTATLPGKTPGQRVVRLSPADRVALRPRLSASKVALLREARDLVEAAVDAAGDLSKEKPAVVGIIVNRVATARAIHRRLAQLHPTTPVDLVIGSMRPIDRDEQADRLRANLGPSRPAHASETRFIVSTQCLEVGADFDFDGLVTQAASLDALRQRFGRLNRNGRDIEARAVILAGRGDVKPEENLDDDRPLDPIYGNAAARTWHWLQTIGAQGAVDFGIEALEPHLESLASDPDRLGRLLSPGAREHAPVLLPVHLDLWCQTAPKPALEPDVATFIHGRRHSEPEVQVCWRADLLAPADPADTADPRKHWPAIVAMLPPRSAECMSIGLSQLRDWLERREGQSEDRGDALDTATPTGDRRDELPERIPVDRTGVVWRGPGQSFLLDAAGELRPGDTLVLSTSAGGWNELGHVPPRDPADTVGPSLPPNAQFADLDRAEAVLEQAKAVPTARLHKVLMSGWDEERVKRVLSALAEIESLDDHELHDLLIDAANEPACDAPRRQLLVQLAAAPGIVVTPYPDGRGALFVGRRARNDRGVEPLPPLDDGDDERSTTAGPSAVTLLDHTAHVEAALARSLALLPLGGEVAAALTLAATWHDLGKADERFQSLLRRSGRTESWLHVGASLPLLAKSAGAPLSRLDRDRLRERSGLPPGFRHEMLSTQLARRLSTAESQIAELELALHVVEAHHGFARPLAPFVADGDPPDVTVSGIAVSKADRLDRPAHRLDSGVAERFWRLTERFGWWGLAYLESLLRLADQEASAREDRMPAIPRERTSAMELTR